METPVDVPLPVDQTRGKSFTLEWSGLNLKKLDLSSVEIEKCPTSLDLSRNQLDNLPADFDDISRLLTSLVLSKNKLIAFPALNCKYLAVSSFKIDLGSSYNLNRLWTCLEIFYLTVRFYLNCPF